MGGEQNMRFFQATGQFHRIRFGALYDTSFNVEGEGRLFTGNDVSDYIMEKIAGMSYRFLDVRTITPWPASYRSQFDGKIWMLIDGVAYSGAMKTAAIHKEIGFATLVTDIRGRPLEYGIDPHYFNRPGMDALETVLAMIAEGAYL